MSPPQSSRSNESLTSSTNGAQPNNNNNYGSVEVNPMPSSISKRASSFSSGRHSSFIKTQGVTFVDDLVWFRQGTIPHSMCLAVTIGIVCGVAAWLYYTCLEWALEYLWETLPEKLVLEESSFWPEWAYAFWIPLVGFTMATGVGLTVVFLGEPGDLPYTIKCVHDKAYVAMDHVLPMVAASQFSILGGGSLGPEAPLVAICAALGGFISRSIFRCTERNIIRKHTLMGMAGALAAFFGCPLGGSLFAMEVNSRFGIEYFEHTVEAIFCGEVCLVVFRAIARLPIEHIWDITEIKLPSTDPIQILYGVGLGLVGAGTAWCYAVMHGYVMRLFGYLNLLDNHKAVQRAWLGAIVIVGIGMALPCTMFWGEFEIKTIATLSPSSTLEHVWPTTGLFSFEMDSCLKCLLVGFAKLVAISFTVAGGYRGGYIFPLFASASALGRAIYFLCPFIPVQLCVLCMAAAVNVAVTRTSIATTLILAYLSGEPNAISAILMSSIVSLFVTGYMPFIKTQISRVDIETSMYAIDEDMMSLSSDTEALTPLSEAHKQVDEVDSDDVDDENQAHV